MKQLPAAPNKWYDEWHLQIGAASGMGMYIRLTLPYNGKIPELYVHGSSVEMKKLANVLDQLLCELTGTVTGEVIIDGIHQPDRP